MAEDNSKSGSRWDVLTQTGAGTPMGELLRRYWWPIAGASEFAEPGIRAGAAARRGPRPLQGSRRPVRASRPPLPASPRRSQLRLCRGMRAALQLSRLALRRRRRLPGAALRGHGAPGAAAARRDPHQSLPGRGAGRAPLGLSRPGAAAAGAGLGILLLAERLPPDRARRDPVQLVPVPGEFDRPGAFRMDPFELVDPARRHAPAPTPRATSRSISASSSTASSTSASARTPTRTTGCGRSAASACGPAACSPATMSSSACRSTTRTRCRVMWHFSRVPHEREPYVQNSIPTWKGPIADPATGRWITSHVMNQDFVTWVGQGRIADRSKEYLAPSDRGIVMIRRRFLARSRGDQGRAGPQGHPPRPRNQPRDPAAGRRAQELHRGLPARAVPARPVQPPQPAGLHLPDRTAAGGARGVSRRDGVYRSRIAVRRGPYDPLAPAVLSGKPG